MNKKHLTILIHLSGWIAFFLVPFLLFNFSHINEPLQTTAIPNPQTISARPALSFFLLRNLFLITFFYVNLFVLLPKFYYVHKKTFYFFTVFAFMILVVVIPVYVQQAFMPGPLPVPVNRAFIRRPVMERMFGFLDFLVIWFLSSIMYMADRYRLMEQTHKEMKMQKLNAELSYLKAQINPHFLFNTLNNIYALSVCQSEHTPEAILKLSAIMRYVTQDANTDTVPLAKELEYLENYITLQQLRSDDKLTVDFTVTGEPETNIIAPLLLINFIENAFKYGISNHIPCCIKIKITICNKKLTLNVTNKIITANVSAGTFTGLNNTLRRLQLQYANKHELVTDSTNNMYKVILQIDLS